MYILISSFLIFVTVNANYYLPREEGYAPLPSYVSVPIPATSENYFEFQDKLIPTQYGTSYGYANYGQQSSGYEAERRIPEDYPVYQYRELPYDYYSQFNQPLGENVYVEETPMPKVTSQRRYLPRLPQPAEYEDENYSSFISGLPSRNILRNNYGYSYAGYIERQVRMYPIMMYTLVQCIPCERAKHMLAVSYRDVSSHFLELGGDEEWQRQLKVDLQQITGALTFPYIFLCGTYIGGASDLMQLHHNGQLRQMANSCSRLPA